MDLVQRIEAATGQRLMPDGSGPGWQDGPARELIAPRRQQLGSLDAVRAEFKRDHSDLLALLGESKLRPWVKETLRRPKERRPELPGQLPLWGQFGDEVRPREERTTDDHMASCSRYALLRRA